MSPGEAAAAAAAARAYELRPATVSRGGGAPLPRGLGAGGAARSPNPCVRRPRLLARRGNVGLAKQGHEVRELADRGCSKIEK